MIGKPQWFQRRKYGGWGIAPKTWQGWAYVAGMILPVIAIQAVPGISDTARWAALAVWLALVCADTVHIMVSMPRDERERIHEAVAERNALWTMIAVLIAGIGYQVATRPPGPSAVDPVILIALAAAVIAKAATNLYLDRKD